MSEIANKLRCVGVLLATTVKGQLIKICTIIKLPENTNSLLKLNYLLILRRFLAPFSEFLLYVGWKLK